MTITIYNPTGQKLIETTVRDESSFTRELMGRHELRLRFDLPESLPLPYGAYTLWQGTTFRLTAPYMPTLREGVAEYDVAFHAVEMELGNYTCFYLSGGSMEAEWRMTAPLVQFAREIEANLRRIGSSLSIDLENLPDTEAKPLNFERETILSALGKIAEAFEVEWWCDGIKLYFGRIAGGEELPIRLGEIAHAFTPEGEGNPLIGRLYAFGAKRNLPPAYRKDKGADLKSSVGVRRLMLPEATPYIEGVAGGLEQVEYFDDIYPRYEGRLSAVSHRKSQDDTIYKISDTALHIPKTYLVEGETFGLRFTSGALQGMDFELSILSDGYEIVPSDSYGQRLPSGQLVPKVGDGYVPYGFDISLVSVEYIPRAEQELKERAERWLRENNEDRRDVEVETNPVYMAERGVLLHLGQAVRLVGAIPTGDKSGRITRIEYPLYCPQMKRCIVGNTKPLNRLERLSVALTKETERAVGETEQKTEALRIDTSRRFREAQEATEALVASLGDRFGGAINPVAVSTMQLLAGDDSLQFVFVDSPERRTARPIALHYDKHSKSVQTQGTHYLMHYTLPDKTLGSAIHTERLRVWTLDPYESTALGQSDKPYYLYAMCAGDSNDHTAAFTLTSERLPLLNEEGDYNLLVGMLSSEDSEGERSFVSLHGFSEILPGRVTTDRIVSASGHSYFDLQTGHINGVITITNEAGKPIMGRTYKDGRTTIDGGLVLSERIGAVDARGKLRTELCGAVDACPVAFRAGISDDGTEANVEIRHSGDARFGQATIDGHTGQYSFRDGEDSYLRIGGELSPIEVLQGKSREQNQERRISLWAEGMAMMHSESIELPEGASFTLRGTLRAGLRINVVEKIEIATLRLIAPSGKKLKEWQYVIYWENAHDDIDILYEAYGLPSGRYQLTLETESRFSQFYSSFSGTAKIETEVKVREIMLASGGMNIFYGHERFVSFQREGEPFMTVRGNVDMYGVLATGRVRSNGTHAWHSGARATGRSERQGSGSRTKYKVYHSMGHQRYHVNIQRLGTFYGIMRVERQENDYFIVSSGWTNLNDTYEMDFTYSIVGEP